MLPLFIDSNQTKKILSKINKKTKVIISIFAGRAADTGKIQYLNLKKVLNFQKNLKMLRFYGQVLENLITTFRQKN